MSQKVRVASIGDVGPGSAIELTVKDRVVALFNVEGALYAIDGICPHAGGPLADGRLRGNVVTCPWHGWQFDVATGLHCLNARLGQSQFPVTVEGEAIFLELPD